MNSMPTPFKTSTFLVLVLILGVSTTMASSEGEANARQQPRQVLAQVTGIAPTSVIAPSDRTAKGRWQSLGGEENPLQVVDRRGQSLGDIYRVEAGGTYQGFLAILGSPSDETALFSTEAWPLSRVASRLARTDQSGDLTEPRIYMVLDENRLIIRADYGKQEEDLDSIPFDLLENERSNRLRKVRPTRTPHDN